ncbi:MAG: NAD(+) diphosphatase [Aminipila sp.]
MIQDIEPRKFDITYRNICAEDDDIALFFEEEKILMKTFEGCKKNPEFICFKDIKDIEIRESLKAVARYLFSIDDCKYFMVNNLGDMQATMKAEGSLNISDILGEEFHQFKPDWLGATEFRGFEEQFKGFAAITAVQISRWLQNHSYCGRCGSPNHHSETERALICNKCGLTEYPKISPAIIVGVVDGEKLLLTRYADRPYKRYALIAGFSEVGETLEDTVRREVFEEVGLKVKDITYYKNQPWSFSDSLLVGFFARLEGSNEVTIQEDELAEATWFHRSDVPVNKETIALTSEMIRYFVAGNDVFKDKTI